MLLSFLEISFRTSMLQKHITDTKEIDLYELWAFFQFSCPNQTTKLLTEYC